MNGLGIKIALLNVLRNSRRSLITLAAITFGCVSLIVFGGFVQSMYDGMRESMIRSQLGHIQVYAQGYNQFSKLAPEKYLISPETLEHVQTILENNDHTLITTPRLNFNGLLSDGKQSLAIMGIGVDAENEALLSSAINIVAGEDLFPEDADGALIGQGLYESLNAKTGDYLTLLASTPDGAINAVDIRIVGVINTGTKALDDRLVRMNLKHAQDLMYTSDVTRLVVLIDDTLATESTQQHLKQAFASANLKLETKRWDQLADYYHQVVGLFDGVFGFVSIIVLIIVALSISNTMMMAVMERTRELGTIRAMGATPMQVVNLILMEATFLGLMGSTLGLGLGVGAAELITWAEWMMPTPPGSTQDYPIRVLVVDTILVQTYFLGVIIALISSIYPAIKAANLPVADALRFS